MKQEENKIMKFSQKGIMIQLTKILTAFFIAVMFFSCKENATQSLKKNNDQFVLYNASNVKDEYQNFQIKISKDSVEIINLKNRNIICFGKIIKNKTTFPKYFKSTKNGNEIKEKLQAEYNFLAIDSLVFSVESYYPNNSITPCEFPFSEFLIVNNNLFFYDEGYQSFVDDKISVNKKSTQKNIIAKSILNNNSKKEVIELPFDANIFINETSKKRREKYVTLKDEELKILKNKLYQGFYDFDNEAIIDIFRLNIKDESFNYFVIISEHEIGYNCSLVSFDNNNNNILSGLVLISVEQDSSSDKAHIDTNLVINLNSLGGTKSSQYKISNGTINQVFDDREYMRDYKNNLQAN